MKEYAEILRAIADGRDVQIETCGTWGDPNSPALVLDCMLKGIAPARLRVKPATININGHEVPEPLRVAPTEGTAYWRVSVSEIQLAGAANTWNDDAYDRRWLARGLCHATKEAAEQHARALLSFTIKE